MELEVKSDSAMTWGEALALPHMRKDVERVCESAMSITVEWGGASLAQVLIKTGVLAQEALQHHLLTACAKGHLEIVKCFYECGVMPELEACVTSALAGGHEDVVHYLLSLPHEYDSFQVLKRGQLPTRISGEPEVDVGALHLGMSLERTLTLAVRTGATNIYKYVFNRCRADITEMHLGNLAMLAVALGNLALFAHTVEEGGVNVTEAMGEYIKLPYLVEACEYGRVDILNYIHARGAPVAEDTDCFRYALENGQMEVVERLTQLGAKFYERRPGETFIEACEKGHLEGVKYMIAHELINVREVGSAGFRKANMNGHFRISEYLLNTEAQFTHSDLALGLIDAAGRCFSLFKQLHQRGAPLKERYSDILYWATKRCDIETIKYCEAHGARVWPRQVTDALMTAAKHGHIEVFDYFRAHYDQLDTITRVQLLEDAVENGSERIAKFILDTSVIDREVYGDRIARAAKLYYAGRLPAYLSERGFRIKPQT